MHSATYHVIHETRYEYSQPVHMSRQILRLAPRTLPWQHCIAHHVHLTPEPESLHIGQDCFGNAIQSFALENDHSMLIVQAESWVELTPRAEVGCLPQDTPPWEHVRDALMYRADHPMPASDLDATRFLFESSHVRIKREFAAYASACFPPGRPLREGIEALLARMHEEFTFDATATTVSTPVTEVFSTRRGVCQDFAHFMLSCLRSLGLAARYVSGYLLTEPPPGQPRLIGADASHAWVSVYCPGSDGGHGIWIDADPTNNILPDTDHITLGWGRDFLDISPLRGVLIGGGQQTMHIAVTVTPSDEYAALFGEAADLTRPAPPLPNERLADVSHAEAETD